MANETPRSDLEKELLKIINDKQGVEDVRDSEGGVLTFIRWEKTKFEFDESRTLSGAENINTLRFDNISFMGAWDKYTLFNQFKNVKRLEFINCNTLSSAIGSDSVLGKMNKALSEIKKDGTLGVGATIMEISFENTKVVHMANVKQFNKLESITLKNVGHLIWNDFAKKAPLIKLTLDTVPVNSKIISNISGIKRLEKLELSDVYDGADVDFNMRGLATLKNITRLRLNNMMIINPFSWINGLKNLQTLDLSRLRITDLSDFEPGGLDNLKELILDNNPIQDINEEGFKNLKELSLVNTRIKKLPIISTIEKLNCSRCDGIDWKGLNNWGSLHADALKNLKRLDVSRTQIDDIEGLVETLNLNNLIYVNISNTEIKELSDSFLDKLKHLEILIAEHLQLESLPTDILKIPDWQLEEKRHEKDIVNNLYTLAEEQKPGDKKYAYLHGTRVLNLPKHFITPKNPKTRQEFWNYEIATHGHQATIVFLGEKDKKDEIMYKLFNVTRADFIKCKGQHILNTRVYLQVFNSTESGSNMLDPNTVLNVLALSQRPQYRSAHTMFMSDNALYVIVINSADAIELQRKADFWFRFVKYSVDSADILFLLLKRPEQDENEIDMERYRTDPRYHVHKKVINLFDESYDDELLETARGRLIHAIQRLPSYTGKTIAGWKNAFRYISELFEVRPSIKYGTDDINSFESICNRYRIGKDGGKGEEYSPEMLEIFRSMLEEADVCYDDGYGTLYSHAWFARFVYALLDHAREQHGRVYVQEFILYLQDTIIEYDYSVEQVKELLDTLSSNKSTNPKKNFSLCFGKKMGSEAEAYYFPQYGYILDAPKSYLQNNSGNQSKEAWREVWSKQSEALRKSEYANHYVINLPFLSDALYVDIICKLLSKLREILGGNAYEIPNEGITSGVEGLVAMFESSSVEVKNKSVKAPPCCLLVDGVPGAPGCIQFYVAPNMEHKDIKEFDFHEALRIRQTELVEHAFAELFKAIGNNNPLLLDMSIYLTLPNHNLEVSVDTPEWRIALRDICFYENTQESTYYYRGWSLPMDILKSLVPPSYRTALSDLLGKK